MNDIKTLFSRVRAELLEKKLSQDGSSLPKEFEALLATFESAIEVLAKSTPYGTQSGQEVEDATEYLREIVFMDGCLGRDQRRDLGARLLVAYSVAMRQSTSRGRERVQEIFQTAPVADYLLSYALAWQLGWFDNNMAIHNSPSTPAVKLLSLHSIKGGTGKTFLAHSYALACARKNKKTAIVDLDFTGPTLQFLGLPQTPSSSVMKAFPLFFSDRLPLFDSELLKSLRKASEQDTDILTHHLFESLNADIAMRVSSLPFEVAMRQPPEEDDTSLEEWQAGLDQCLRKSTFLASVPGEIYHVILPHRPEFLRRAGQLLERPDWRGWRLIREWLTWLVEELRRRGFEVVIFDNAPGASNTSVIMNLVWGLNGTIAAQDRAVCFVSSPRIPDVVNTAYELLWVQASDWTRSIDAESKRKVYWVGNMWTTGSSLEAMVARGRLSFLHPNGMDDSNPARLLHGGASGAHSFAGLTDDDIERIETVLQIAFRSGRLIPSQLQYYSDLRRLFDFDIKSSELPQLDDLLDDLLRQEPLRTLLGQG